MKNNMVSADRIFRIIFAILVGILYFTGIIGGILGTSLIAVGGILLATALINFCPIYAILGINFSKK